MQHSQYVHSLFPLFSRIESNSLTPFTLPSPFSSTNSRKTRSASLPPTLHPISIGAASSLDSYKAVASDGRGETKRTMRDAGVQTEGPAVSPDVEDGSDAEEPIITRVTTRKRRAKAREVSSAFLPFFPRRLLTLFLTGKEECDVC
jgi:hypothetical protein